MHSESVRLWNHPSHDLDCCLDRAALLTRGGQFTPPADSTNRGPSTVSTEFLDSLDIQFPRPAKLHQLVFADDVAAVQASV